MEMVNILWQMFGIFISESYITIQSDSSLFCYIIACLLHQWEGKYIPKRTF